MKVLSVVGARPQFVKLAPVADAMSRHSVEHVIAHTGQHYDDNMSEVFFRDLGIPKPDVHLGVGSGSHGVQTGAMLGALDGVLEEHDPDWVLVYGDTNSTLAGALSAVKMHLPLAHLEAGLRSFNRRMPEEHNRILTDHAADLCLAPTERAADHLRAEGLSSRTVVTGDVMTDVCLATARRTAAEKQSRAAVAEGDYVLATLHRAENTDDPERLRSVVEALSVMPVPVVLTAHPRLLARAQDHGIDLNAGSISVIAPLDYASMVAAVQQALAVVTDSGGLQKEAFLLRTPCTTVRTETEWAETVDLRWNELCPDPADIVSSALRVRPNETDVAPYGTGNSADLVVETLASWDR
ncbi:UDP-N-acetylglucosamine 2-epimerase (non-hydrolyzing) [Terrabacter ginsenosidimutans]|uniref:UDP-N-acetylglucosamine 2-epimerase (Non-hydrolyzing) n=1 Tax=Terrabacter ginsenosidimutans TaxID=490575 RepID=A0ABP7DYV2_9MICO